MSRRGPKPGKRCKVCKAIHGPPFCTNPSDVASVEQMVAELVRVDAVLRAAGIASEQSGGIAAAVRRLVNDRIELHLLRMELALQPPEMEPQSTEQPPAATDAPPT